MWRWIGYGLMLLLLLASLGCQARVEFKATWSFDSVQGQRQPLPD